MLSVLPTFLVYVSIGAQWYDVTIETASEVIQRLVSSANFVLANHLNWISYFFNLVNCPAKKKEKTNGFPP